MYALNVLDVYPTSTSHPCHHITTSPHPKLPLHHPQQLQILILIPIPIPFLLSPSYLPPCTLPTHPLFPSPHLPLLLIIIPRKNLQPPQMRIFPILMILQYLNLN